MQAIELSDAGLQEAGLPAMATVAGSTFDQWTVDLDNSIVTTQGALIAERLKEAIRMSPVPTVHQAPKRQQQEVIKQLRDVAAGLVDGGHYLHPNAAA